MILYETRPVAPPLSKETPDKTPFSGNQQLLACMKCGEPWNKRRDGWAIEPEGLMCDRCRIKGEQ